MNIDAYAQRKTSNDTELQYSAPNLQPQVYTEGRGGESVRIDATTCSMPLWRLMPRWDNRIGLGVATVSA